MQRVLSQISSWGIDPKTLGRIGLVVLVLFLSFVVRNFVISFAQRWLSKRRLLVDGVLVKDYFNGSLAVIIVAVLSHLALPLFELPPKIENTLTHIAQILWLAGLTWFLVRLTYFVRLILYNRFDVSAADNIRARRMRTQLQFIGRIIVLTIGVIGFSAVLLTFEGARRIGTSLLASAGVASVVIGFAAQKSLANLIAGFQIAFTQPIRIDDVVIVETEWGRIEEITLTYVVVKLWDLRRMVLPITYFVEKPFQNWTRNSADILGYSYLYMDYAVPVEEVRKALRTVCEGSSLWDKQVCILQVTDLREHVLELRCLVSARNASDAFDLRCEIREKLVTFIKNNYPDALPRMRAQVLAANTTKDLDDKEPVIDPSKKPAPRSPSP